MEDCPVGIDPLDFDFDIGLAPLADQAPIAKAVLRFLPSYRYGYQTNCLYSGEPSALLDLQNLVQGPSLLRPEHGTIKSQLYLPLSVAVSHVLYEKYGQAVLTAWDLRTIHEGPSFVDKSKVALLNHRPGDMEARAAQCHDPCATSLETMQILLDTVAEQIWGPKTTILLGTIMQDIGRSVYNVDRFGRTDAECIMGIAWLASEVDEATLADVWIPLASCQAAELACMPCRNHGPEALAVEDEVRLSVDDKNLCHNTKSKRNHSRNRGRRHAARRAPFPGSPDPDPDPVPKRARASNIDPLHENLPTHLTAAEILRQHPNRLNYNNLLRVALFHSNAQIYSVINEARVRDKLATYRAPSTVVKRIDRAIAELSIRICVPETIKYTLTSEGRGESIQPVRVAFDYLRRANGVMGQPRDLDAKLRVALEPYWDTLMEAFNALVPLSAQMTQCAVNSSLAGPSTALSEQDQLMNSQDAEALAPIALFNRCFDNAAIEPLAHQTEAMRSSDEAVKLPVFFKQATSPTPVSSEVESVIIDEAFVYYDDDDLPNLSALESTSAMIEEHESFNELFSFPLDPELPLTSDDSLPELWSSDLGLDLDSDNTIPPHWSGDPQDSFGNAESDNEFCCPIDLGIEPSKPYQDDINFVGDKHEISIHSDGGL